MAGCKTELLFDDEIIAHSSQSVLWQVGQSGVIKVMPACGCVFSSSCVWSLVIGQLPV